MRDALYFTKLRVFLGQWRWRAHRQAAWMKARLRRLRRRARRLSGLSPSVFTASVPLTPYASRFVLEPMEQRLLLAADLTGVVQSAALIDPAVPTNTASAVVRVQNSGNANVTQSQIGVYASLDNVLDAPDLLLGTANTGSVAVGASKNVTVNLTFPNTLQPVDYTLLAKVDNANAITENSETNNVAVGGTINGTWQFGTVPGRTGNTTLTLREADGTIVTFRLTGPGTGEVITDGTQWDLHITGTTADSAVTITTTSAGSGRVTLNDIHVLGPIGTLLAATTDLTGTLAIDGPVNIPGAVPGTVTLRSVQGGTVVMPSVEALTILGPTTNAKFSIGAMLGQDGQPGGTGGNADSYGQGKIGLFTVSGAMTNTTVRVGVDPVDGTYGNGNDQLISGSVNEIGGIVIGGSLSADTRFYAGKFPTQYLHRLTLKPTVGDFHFVTLVSGSPTTLNASLQQDTGSSTSDGLTKDPTIVGTLTDLDGIATFTAGFGATLTFNVLSDRQSNGAFTFSRARLEEIARSEGIMNTGEAMPDGTYVLTLRATDSGGNPTQISVPFTLDTAVPTLTLDLVPSSDTLPLGDQQTTNATVTLNGQTEANAAVELVGLGLTTTADATGQFSFTNVALALGANTFIVRATDAAGNQRTEERTITRQQPDSDGDGVLDVDESGGANGGDANNDGTPDSQQANVASLRNAIDNEYVTLVSPTGTQLIDATAGPIAPGAPSGVEFPFGQIGFEVHGVTPGGSAEVTMLLPDGSGVNSFYKFGPEPGASPLNQPHWYDFNLNGGTGAAISGNTVTLNLIDGARGDSDLAENGVIVDPGAPVSTTVRWTGLGNDGNWLNPLNWTGNRTPGSTSDVVIPDGVTVGYNNYDNSDILTIKSLTMGSSTTFGVDSPFGVRVLGAITGGSIQGALLGLIVDGPVELESLHFGSGEAHFNSTAHVGTLNLGIFDPQDPRYTGLASAPIATVIGQGRMTIGDLSLGGGAGLIAQEIVLTGQAVVAYNFDPGSLTITPGASLELVDLGVNAFPSTFGSVVNEGTLQVATGRPLSLNGDYTQTGTGVLQVGVGEHNEFGTIEVGGAAMLAGTLTVTGPTDTADIWGFPLMTVTSHTGAFTTVNLPTPVAGQTFTIDNASATSLTFKVDAELEISITDAGPDNEFSGAPLPHQQVFVVSLNVAVPGGETVMVDYATADETATAGSDYVATSGTLVFEPGERSKFIYVTWSDDGFVEPTETYLVVLSRPSNATLADSQGRATILDDDVNQRAPVTTADTYTTTEDIPLVRNAAQGVLVNDTDPDTLPEDLMARLAGSSATNHGSVILNADGSFTYTPSPGFSGIDQFSYFVNDGAHDSSETVTINVTAVNDAPVAGNDALTAAEDQAETYTASQLLSNDTDVDSSTLTIARVTSGGDGTIVLNSDGTVTFTPAVNFNGEANFSYTVTDGDLTSDPATVTVNVAAVNDVPVAQASTVTTNEDQAKTFAVSDFGFTDVEGDSLASITINSLTLASGDRLKLSGTDVTAGQTITAANIANLVYTPAANANGSARSTFAFTVNDAASGTEAATMTINVTAVNQVPVAAPDTLTATEDTAETYLASQLVSNDTDGDEDALTVASVTNGTGGTVVLNGNGTVTFTPTANFNGEANFSYTVTDGDLTSDPATVTVNVAAVNDAPSFTTGPDQAVQEDAGAITVPNWATSISAGPSDESGQQLTFVVTNDNNTLFSVQPSVAPDGTLTFASAPNVSGTATVTVMLRDDGGTANGGSDTSAAQTLSLTVNPVNDGPTVLNPIADVTVPEDAADTVIDLAGATPVFADVETAAGALTYSVTSSAPSVVAATVDNVSDKLTLAYPPNASGTATITVTASDGVLTVSDSFEVTVTPINQAPVANAQNVTTAEDTTKQIVLSGSDGDNDSLTYVIDTAPQHGTLTGTGSTRTYTPDANYSGPDSLTFRVNDGTVDSAPATVAITVTPVNDSPVLAPIGNRSVNEGDRLTFNVNASDPDGPTSLTFSLENGIGGEVPPGASIDALGTFTWMPMEVQGPGSYTFDVVVTDSGTSALSGRETITITVAEVNRAPTLQAISDQTITAGQQLMFTAVGIDFDLPANTPASSLIYSLDLSQLPPGYGTLNTPSIDPSTGVFTWTPAEGQVGMQVITVRVVNELGDGLFAEQDVRFNVESSNHAPQLNPIADQTVNEGEVLRFTAVATDQDAGQVLVFSLINAPAEAQITSSGEFSWSPTEAQGPEVYPVTLAVTDGMLTTSRTFSVTVNEVNVGPTLNSIGNKTVNEEAELRFTIGGADVDQPGQSLAYSATGLPSGANFNSATREFVWTPTELQGSGSYPVTFSISDGVASASETITITVIEVNDAPVAIAQTLTTVEGTAKPITLVGSDVDNDSLTYSIVTEPQHGTLTGTGPNRTYTPATNFFGVDSFTFRVNDGQEDSNVATVTVTVTPAVAGVHWINQAGGDWNLASNWSTGSVPTATDDVLIDLAGTYTITHSTGATQIKSLKSEHQINLTGGTLEVAETVEMNGAMLTLAGGTLKNSTITGTGMAARVVQVAGTGRLDGVTLQGATAIYVPTGAELTVLNGLNLVGPDAGHLAGLHIDGGAVIFGGPIGTEQTLGGAFGSLFLEGAGSHINAAPGLSLNLTEDIFTFSVGGTIGSSDSFTFVRGGSQVAGNGSLVVNNVHNLGHMQINGAGFGGGSGVLSGTSFINSGTIEVQIGSALTLDDFSISASDGTLSVTAPVGVSGTVVMTVANPIENRGLIQLAGGGNPTLIINGSLANTNTGRVFFGQPVSSTGQGTIQISGDVTNGPDATIDLRDGSLIAGGNLLNEGRMDLESGLMQVTGDYVQATTGTLEINTTNPADLGRLVIEGAALLDGNFEVFVGGTLASGDRYQFMTFSGGRNGFFTTVQIPLFMMIDDTDPTDLDLVVL